MQSSLLDSFTVCFALLPGYMCYSAQAQIICIRKWWEAGTKNIKIGTSQWMITGKTCKKKMVIDDNNISHCILVVEA
jgi:hypothetical protein